MYLRKSYSKSNLGIEFFIDKKEKCCKIIDIAIPGDSRVNEKEREKMEKYQLLKDELVRLWDLKKVNVIPVVIAALGLVSSKCKKHLEKLEKNIETVSYTHLTLPTICSV